MAILQNAIALLLLAVYIAGCVLSIARHRYYLTAPILGSLARWCRASRRSRWGTARVTAGPPRRRRHTMAGFAVDQWGMLGNNVGDMGRVNVEDILGLPIPERLGLVEMIWDSIAASPEDLPLTEAQRAELQRRLDAHAENPSAVESWDEVKARIRRRT